MSGFFSKSVRVNPAGIIGGDDPDYAVSPRVIEIDGITLLPAHAMSLMIAAERPGIAVLAQRVGRAGLNSQLTAAAVRKFAQQCTALADHMDTQAAATAADMLAGLRRDQGGDQGKGGAA